MFNYSSHKRRKSPKYLPEIKLQIAKLCRTSTYSQAAAFRKSMPESWIWKHAASRAPESATLTKLPMWQFGGVTCHGGSQDRVSLKKRHCKEMPSFGRGLRSLLYNIIILYSSQQLQSLQRSCRSLLRSAQ